MSGGAHEHELWQLLDKAQMNLRQLSAQIVEIRSQVAALNLPTPTDLTCPTCKLRFKRADRLAEHIYTSHDGPLPDHYKAAEAAADPNA